MEGETLNRIVKHLQTPQRRFKDPDYEKPDLFPFPVEFEYFGRCLHQLGSLFSDMKIMDIRNPTFEQAILYCLSGGSEIQLNEKVDNNVQKICDLLGINVLLVGPDEESRSIWVSEESEFSDQEPWVILYRAYDGLIYPIISLEKKDFYLFYRKNNSILQQLVPGEELSHDN